MNEIYYLYCPLKVQKETYTRYGDLSENLEEIDAAIEYLQDLREAIDESQFPEEGERGLMQYYDGDPEIERKVQFYYPEVTTRNGVLIGAVKLRLSEMLSREELEKLKEAITGQLSDGWGEGFEQHPVHTRNGNLYVSFWNGDGDWELIEDRNLQEAITEYELRKDKTLSIQLQSVWEDTKPVTLLLPMDENALLIAMNKAGIQNTTDRCWITEVNILEQVEWQDIHLANLQEAQALAEALHGMNSEEIEEALYCAFGNGSAVEGNRLIAACEQAGNYAYIPGAKTEEEVGQFLVNNNLIPELEHIPEAAMEYLKKSFDYEKIMERYEEQYGGFFCGKGYAVPQFDQENPPSSYTRHVTEPTAPLSLKLRMDQEQAAQMAAALSEMEELLPEPEHIRDIRRILEAQIEQAPGMEMQGM